MPQELRDYYKKGLPKSWQDKRVLRHIRKCYTLAVDGKNRRLKTALVIYLVLTEIASNIKSDVFQTTFNTIALNAGLSNSTVRRYTQEFIKISVISKENIKQGKANQANRWSLLEYSPMVFASAQNDKQRLLGHTTKILTRDSSQDNEQPSAQDNEQDKNLLD